MNTYQEIQIMRNRCEIMILSMVGKDYTNIWWNSPNKAFQGKTPNEMFDTDPEQVYDYIIGHINGYG